MNRRELLGGAAAGVATAAVAQEAGGPFAQPTARFDKARQHVLPPGAFERELEVPLVARPTAVGTYRELTEGDGRTGVFGPGDPRPIGEVFHGVAREWGETPEHWRAYGCDPAKPTAAERWDDKTAYFGEIPNHAGGAAIRNWGGFKIKCYKIPIREGLAPLRAGSTALARVYTYAGTVPGPSLKMRLGQPAVVRFENHLETETSVHLHGGHSPSHSDGFPSFYVLQGKARDYFYPNILPLLPHGDSTPAKPDYRPDLGESQSTMWYHDHGLDVTGFNVSKGLAGFAPCFGENELGLLRDRVLPGYGPASCDDPERDGLRLDNNGRPDASFEDDDHPGFYKAELGKEPYFNPFDIPLVLQDKVIDPRTGQIAYDNTGHNGYLGDTHLVNGVPWPKLRVRNRKYRFRVLDGSNARVYRLRLMTYEAFLRANRDGIDAVNTDGPSPLVVTDPAPYDRAAKPFLRVGKDSWLWQKAVEQTSLVLAMANRADLVIDFGALTAGLKAGEERAFVLVNTMPQADGRGPKLKLEDGGDPRVLPLPFDTPGRRLVELNRPIGLLKFVVRYDPPGGPNDPPGDVEASVVKDTPLLRPGFEHVRIRPEQVRAVRHFRFERGKGAWQVNGRFYDPTIANAAPVVDGAEEWVFENGGGGWWHPIHVHLESHQLIRYEKDFGADDEIDRADDPAPNPLNGLEDVTPLIDGTEVEGFHDTMVLGPNTQVRVRMKHRTWAGPFVFHCHNLEHEDMRMMFNFEPVPDGPARPHDPNVVPDARTHGNDVTLGRKVGELPWEFPPVPATPARDAGENVVPPRPKR